MCLLVSCANGCSSRAQDWWATWTSVDLEWRGCLGVKLVLSGLTSGVCVWQPVDPTMYQEEWLGSVINIY